MDAECGPWGRGSLRLSTIYSSEQLRGRRSSISTYEGNEWGVMEWGFHGTGRGFMQSAEKPGVGRRRGRGFYDRNAKVVGPVVVSVCNSTSSNPRCHRCRQHRAEAHSWLALCPYTLSGFDWLIVVVDIGFGWGNRFRTSPSVHVLLSRRETGTAHPVPYRQVPRTDPSTIQDDMHHSFRSTLPISSALHCHYFKWYDFSLPRFPGVLMFLLLSSLGGSLRWWYGDAVCVKI